MNAADAQRVGTKNLFMNGWTRDGQKKYNDLMLIIRKDRHYYAEEFDKGFTRFCKKMEKMALEKKPAKRKRTDAIDVYSGLNLPAMNLANVTQEAANQIKATNEEIKTWECDELNLAYI